MSANHLEKYIESHPDIASSWDRFITDGLSDISDQELVDYIQQSLDKGLADLIIREQFERYIGVQLVSSDLEINTGEIPAPDHAEVEPSETFVDESVPVSKQEFIDSFGDSQPETVYSPIEDDVGYEVVADTTGAAFNLAEELEQVGYSNDSEYFERDVSEAATASFSDPATAGDQIPDLDWSDVEPEPLENDIGTDASSSTYTAFNLAEELEHVGVQDIYSDDTEQRNTVDHDASQSLVEPSTEPKTTTSQALDWGDIDYPSEPERAEDLSGDDGDVHRSAQHSAKQPETASAETGGTDRSKSHGRVVSQTTDAPHMPHYEGRAGGMLGQMLGRAVVGMTTSLTHFGTNFGTEIYNSAQNARESFSRWRDQRKGMSSEAVREQVASFQEKKLQSKLNLIGSTFAQVSEINEFLQDSGDLGISISELAKMASNNDPAAILAKKQVKKWAASEAYNTLVDLVNESSHSFTALDMVVDRVTAQARIMGWSDEQIEERIIDPFEAVAEQLEQVAPELKEISNVLDDAEPGSDAGLSLKEAVSGLANVIDNIKSLINDLILKFTNRSPTTSLSPGM
ncbi:hypothetical protein [Marinobacterium jannaschii]|uniref:hypothetical protein n=1 Tax=Marinobacterium jannaschii TaxID=64970 RepID=UPI0004840D75|nr:hypothetical protein [Marinobacterium jannaschii]